jgi:hypothetical protein
MTDFLDTLEALARAATPPDTEWLDALFADQWTPRCEEYLRALFPERVLALLAVVKAAKAMRATSNYLHESAQERAYDAALAELEADRLEKRLPAPVMYCRDKE